MVQFEQPSQSKLLYIDHAPALGGAERSLLLLLERQERQRWQPYLACPEGSLKERTAELGIPVHRLSLPRLRHSPRFLVDWLSGARAIARLARRTGVALLVANTVRSAVYAALAARLHPTSFAWYMRDFWLSETRPRHVWFDVLVKKLLCNSASLVIANSFATARHLPCSRKVHVVYNGIEVQDYDPALYPLNFRQKYGIPFEAPLIGMVSRLRPWKGPERFLEMVRHILSTFPEAYSVLVGGDPFRVDDHYMQHLKRLAEKLGLSNRVTFTGHLADVRPALAAMDVFVHPGDPEPFGRVNLEAMAMSKPVVAFAHGALPEIVIHGETGLLVPPGGLHELASAVVTLIQDIDRRRAMGQSARQRVETCFNSGKMVRSVEDLFQVLVENHPQEGI